MERDTWLKIKFFMAIVCIAWMAFVCITAGAATLKGNPESCEQLSNVVMQAGEVRDSGVPWEIFKAKLDETISEARKNPATFVQTDADVAFVVRSVHLLWLNPKEIPLLVAAAVYESCMGK